MNRTTNRLPPAPQALPTSPPPSSTPVTLRIRPIARRGGNLLVNIPIGSRLTLGFLLAALIAALVTGTIGVLRSQSLTNQSDFYQNLLQTNTHLTTGAQFLQEMNAETKNMLSLVNTQQPSLESLQNDQKAMTNLVNGYDAILAGYINHDLLNKHQDQQVLLAEAGHTGQIKQQEALAASTLRTWQVCRSAQEQILQNINNGQFADAQTLEQLQVEPTNADALSAVRSLVLFNNRLATSIKDAAAVEEQDQIISTIIGAVIAFLLISGIGWVISTTIVRRLHSLRRVTRAVERGQLDRRINVVGRDEIADVSASVNAMLDAIVNLLQETRSQRDALSNAAEHLFSDIRVVSAGDLRINAPVSNDPIGMLANAFNFTVGRFRRFVLRTRTAIEQLEVMARQGIERADSFSLSLQNIKTESLHVAPGAAPVQSSDRLPLVDPQSAALLAQVRRTREDLLRISNEGVFKHTRTITALTERITTSVDRLSKITKTENMPYARNVTTDLMKLHAQELHTLEPLLSTMVGELHSVQQHALRGFQEIDKDLALLTTALHAEKSKVNSNVATPAVSQELVQDMLRQSSAFANDVTAMARQLASLAQEMRTGVVSFQLDTVEHTSGSAPSSGPIGGYNPSTAVYNLAADTPAQQSSSPSQRLPPYRRKTVMQ